MNGLATTTTMVDSMLLKVGVRRSLAVDLALIVGFSWFIALFARISFLQGTVPISGQTFAVLLTGALLGSRLGGLSLMAYVAQGIYGLPVFAISATMGYGGGIARLAGPTGGYIMGFVVAAFIVGLLAERGWDRRFWSMALAMLVGNVVIYFFGLPWLSHFGPFAFSGLKQDWLWADPTTGGLFMAGLYPFIPGDLIKLVLATAMVPSGWAWLSRLRG
ncbi:MAG: biotin transporter BioY [Dehalococcoidia bacterium]